MTVTEPVDQLPLWGLPEPPSEPRETPRRFLAVSPERERELVAQGAHMSRQEADRIQRRYGL